MSDRLVVLRDIKAEWGRAEWGIIWQFADDDVDSDETIAESEWVISPNKGITLVSHGNTDDTTWFLIGGGIKGVTYSFSNRVLTSEGRRFVRIIVIEIV